MDIEGNLVDDAGTDQDGARNILRTFCDNGFEGDAEQAGFVLGRPASELREMLDGDIDVDDDLVMKARGIAQERGIDVE